MYAWFATIGLLVVTDERQRLIASMKPRPTWQSRDGLYAVDIDTLAARLHCSRATIYRYASGKAQIRDAVLVRLAAGIIDTVRHAVDGLSGPERVVTAITVALEQIRSDPLRRLMLSAGQSNDLDELHSSPVLEPSRR